MVINNSTVLQCKTLYLKHRFVWWQMKSSFVGGAGVLGRNPRLPIPLNSFRSVFPLTVGPAMVLAYVFHSLLSTLSRFQVPEGTVEQHLSFWDSWQKSSVSQFHPKQPLALQSPASLVSFLSSLSLQNESYGTNKPFSLLFCFTLNVSPGC